MRRFIASSFVALMLTLGLPFVGTANGTAASVFGQVVDAGGRGSGGTRVELLMYGAAVGTTTTSSDGRFIFSGIVPGTYVVRAMVKGQPAGLQVSLKAGESAPLLVVLPSMVTAQAQVQLASLLANLSTTLAGVAGATVVTEAVAEAAEDEDNDKIVDAIENNTIVTVLAQAIASVSGSLSPQQQAAISITLGQIIASLPPSAPPEVAQELQVALTAVQTGQGGTVGGITIPPAPVNNNNPVTGSGTL
jgi:hypothetical protein